MVCIVIRADIYFHPLFGREINVAFFCNLFL